MQAEKTQHMINHPKAQVIKHPSGALYDAFCDFFGSRPGSPWYQSDECFRYAATHPVAEACLLVALHDTRLSDPGAHFGLKQPGHHPVHDSRAGKSLIAGSLLAIRLHIPTKKGVADSPGGLHRRLGSCILVAGGPLLADDSRLQKEIALKTLLRALQERFGGQAVYTRIFGSEVVHDFPNVFRELGFRRQDEALMQTDLDSLTAWAEGARGYVPIPGREKQEAGRTGGKQDPGSSESGGIIDIPGKEKTAGDAAGTTDAGASAKRGRQTEAEADTTVMKEQGARARKAGDLVDPEEGFFRVNNRMRYILAKLLSFYR